MMDRVGDSVARELSRFGSAGSGMEPVVEAWPTVVGEVIARNAWPARLARDGTLHVHTKDSIWAFELTSRAEEIRSRLGDVAPPRLAFAAGPLPERTPLPPEKVPGGPIEPSPAQRAQADSLTRGIRDPDLREIVAKTIAASLSNAGHDRPFW
jgi:Dna[CI] antecedent, DciA